MKLGDFYKGTKPLCLGFRNRENCIDGLFAAAGASPYMSVSYKRQLCNGDKPFTVEMKSYFRGKDNQNSLNTFFARNIQDGKLKDAIAAFGIPEPGDVDKRALSIALAKQFRAIVDSDEEDGDDIVGNEYLRAKENPVVAKATEAFRSALYPGDNVHMNSPHRPCYQVNVREEFTHSWDFTNVGTQTWRGRKLFFSNHAEVRPRASQIYIDIPDTPPSGNVKISVNMNAHGFENLTECAWIMIDEEGRNCFSFGSTFAFLIDAKFEFNG